MLINAMSWVYLFISCKGASSTTVMNESQLHNQDKAFLVFVLLTPEVVQGTVSESINGQSQPVDIPPGNFLNTNQLTADFLWSGKKLRSNIHMPFT